MGKRINCSIEGCDKPVATRGWCEMHYGRWRRNGTTDDPRPSLLERFWSKVDRRGADECWTWRGGLNSHGYGNFYIDTVAHHAHRVAHQWFIGSIPEGLDVDHVCHGRDAECAGGDGCRHRACVNPAHLEAVTRRENLRRGRARLTSHA